MRNILHTVVFKLKGYYLCLLILWLLNYCLSRNFWVFFPRFSRAEMKEVRARQCPLGLHIAPHIKCRGFHPAAPKHSHTHKFCMSFSFAAAAAAVAWKHAVQTKEVGEQRGTMRAPNQCDNSRQMAINNFSFFGWHFRSRGCCRQLLAPLRAHTHNAHRLWYHKPKWFDNVSSCLLLVSFQFSHSMGAGAMEAFAACAGCNSRRGCKAQPFYECGNTDGWNGRRMREHGRLCKRQYLVSLPFLLFSTSVLDKNKEHANKQTEKKMNYWLSDRICVCMEN